MLFLCDDSGRYVSGQLKQVLKEDHFKMETIIKPNARLEDVIDSIDRLAGDFSARDCVVVMAGKNNFSNGKYPKFRFICDKLRSCSASVVFVSAPVYSNNPDLCKYILKFNTRLNAFLQRVNNFMPSNLSYVEANGLDGFKVRDRIILDRVLTEITIQKRLPKNLVFIETVNVAPVNLGSGGAAFNDLGRESGFFR